MVWYCVVLLVTDVRVLLVPNRLRIFFVPSLLLFAADPRRMTTHDLTIEIMPAVRFAIQLYLQYHSNSPNAHYIVVRGRIP
jgi:hypothetical protein